MCGDLYFFFVVLYATAGLLLLILLNDLLIYAKPILETLRVGNRAVVGIDVGLLVISSSMILIARGLFKRVRIEQATSTVAFTQSAD